jgi:hypothetical protein
MQQAPFAKEHDTERMVQLRIGEGHTLHRCAAETGLKRAGKTGQLLANIGGGVQQEPPLPVGADRSRRLGARQSAVGLFACGATGRAPAIPLRKAATSSCT